MRARGNASETPLETAVAGYRTEERDVSFRHARDGQPHIAVSTSTDGSRAGLGLRARRYGVMIRPGALLTPVWVWHELQSPEVCAVTMIRSVTLAV